MTIKQGFIAPFAALLSAMAAPSSAGQLDVSPILLELNGASNAGTLKLHSAEAEGVAVQTRVLRWTQVNGVEKLEPTTDVVASPPAVRLTANSEYVVRVVRVSKTPVVGEESYRVFVDQLPSSPRSQGPNINLVMRQSIPVFFRAAKLNPAKVAWTIVRGGDGLSLTAANLGDERLRIAALRARDPSGKEVSFGNGLVGYVLGHSSMRWTFPPTPAGFERGKVGIAAQTNLGALEAIAN